MKSAIGKSRSWHNVFSSAGDSGVEAEIEKLEGFVLAHWSWLLRWRLLW